MATKLYPIGMQTFSEIREEDFLYVDKTEYIYRMTHTSGKYFFLSRPRRFGKSLLVSTMQSYFEGKKDGTEVVQVYVKDPADTEGPLKSLKAFERVEVKAGKTAEAVITLDSRNFELFDAATNTVRAKAGKYEVYYGSSSADKDLKKLDVSIEY